MFISTLYILYLYGSVRYEITKWLFAHGIMPLYTPIGGSWLNMVESVQRILVRRAFSGQYPQNAQEVIDWLEPNSHRECQPPNTSGILLLPGWQARAPKFGPK
ncbi:hypothetical protein [Dictyobacter arantiisoli]|uniref:Uncharacterized protein n=1 Tax=Dictyobacter arantiisoli TaxID=2014874 RepID=A0A5A5TK31_9CHLR|nr:hypothetical protein [Dictyobacter arantiisoli]GCF11991.1 hypothetical protein KDI_55550 [Dictyobacter arantiisoli]